MPSTTVRMLRIIWNAATMMLLIMGTINITNYESTKQSAEQLLNILADNEGVFPQPEKPADQPSRFASDLYPAFDFLRHCRSSDRRKL